MIEESPLKDLRKLKSRLIDAVLMAGTPIGLAAFVLSLFPFNSIVLSIDLVISSTVIFTLFCTFIFKNKIAVEYKTGLIILMIYTIFASELFVDGIYTNDLLFIMLIPFLSLLFYSYGIAVLLYLFTICTYLIAGFLTTTGSIPVPYDYTTISFVNWIENALVLTVVIFVISLFLYQFEKKIFSLVEDLHAKNDYLTEREALLTTITDNFPRSYVSLIDSNFRIIMTGGSEFKTQGIDPADYNGKTVMEVFAEFGDELLNTILEAYKKTLSGKGQILEIKLGDQYQIYKTMPLPDKSGNVHSFLAVVENITDTVKTQLLLEENLNEKNVMLQEIHHRVKNNLAVVSGLLELQSYTIEDDQSKFIISKSINRILSIAKVHEMLYNSKNFNRIPFEQYIDELSQFILESMNDDGKNINFSTQIDIEYININHGVPLGIIMNELITNSVKYGFNGSENNSINLTVSANDNYFEVVYEDNGVGIEDFDKATTKSLGFTLINSLMHQIEANYNYETNNKFKLSFSFPSQLENNPYVLQN